MAAPRSSASKPSAKAASPPWYGAAASAPSSKSPSASAMPCADPVVGIMIRTRIGLNVYGTNTELEQLKLGPCLPGATARTRLRLLVRALPSGVHPDRGLPRPRRRLARLARRRRRLQRQRHPLHRRRLQPPRPGKSPIAKLALRSGTGKLWLRSLLLLHSPVQPPRRRDHPERPHRQLALRTATRSSPPPSAPRSTKSPAA